jgi:hypothetical protein
MALILLQSFFFQTESKHAVAAGDLPPRNAAQQRSTAPEQMPSHCVEASYGSSGSTNVLVRLDHVASFIVNADHRIM